MSKILDLVLIFSWVGMTSKVNHVPITTGVITSCDFGIIFFIIFLWLIAGSLSVKKRFNDKSDAILRKLRLENIF